jgi:hypothetical protein
VTGEINGWKWLEDNDLILVGESVNDLVFLVGSPV